MRCNETLYEPPPPRRPVNLHKTVVVVPGPFISDYKIVVALLRANPVYFIFLFFINHR